MNIPFKLPVRIEDQLCLVAEDCELISSLYDATPAESEAIVKMLNGYQDAANLVRALEQHLDWIGWGDSYERECSQDLRLQLQQFQENVK